ncbi:MAG: glycerophosphodiester phosphodiesterase family protein [Bryobacteraceae bacterium]
MTSKKLRILVPVLGLLLPFVLTSQGSSDSNTQTVIQILQAAKQEAAAHGGHYVPVLSPIDRLVTGQHPTLDSRAVQEAAFPVVVWTVDDPKVMAELIAKRVDGIISDRPDLLREAVSKARSQPGNRKDQAYFARFDSQGHRGGRDLRPENTLPAFESGLDQLVSTLETDTGVTGDRVSLISHEPFINPQTCRRADGQEYTTANQVLIKDIRMAEAQSQFICDKVFRGPQQRNDLSLSPVAMAFANKNRLRSPYLPTHAAQLFEFVRFYASYYRSGPGKAHANAEERWRNAEKVRFNLETKIDPRPEYANRTFGPSEFTETLAGTIEKNGMESRSDIQSFDFRTLHLAAKTHPRIRTVFLIESIPTPPSSSAAGGRK